MANKSCVSDMSQSHTKLTLDIQIIAKGRPSALSQLSFNTIK